MWIDRVFSRRIRHGTLHIEFADGSRRRYGKGEPIAHWRVTDPRVIRRIFADPDFMLGQSYMDGEWDAPRDGLLPLLEVLMRNFPVSQRALPAMRRLILPFQQWNRARVSRRNVSAHYDLDERMFRQFLDADMHYSCAYFARPEMTLEQAQQAKCEHIRRKLNLHAGQRVLDIGCGWGGLAMYLAEHADVTVIGLTLSREQQRVAQERIRQRGLEQRVQVLLEDYREHEGEYDRIVSVGMFEHVGAPFFGRYFQTLYQRLRPDGLALVHTIGRHTPPTLTSSWIRRYIFPGGYIPAMSEVMAAVEPTGLICTDVEVLRRHYALTLLEWLRRFQRVRPAWAQQRGEAFCRMWEFYLAASAGSFLWRSLVVFQFQLSRGCEAVPITREYLYADPIAAELSASAWPTDRSA